MGESENGVNHVSNREVTNIGIKNVTINNQQEKRREENGRTIINITNR